MAGDPRGVVQFNIRTPLDDETVRAHIRAALLRDLPEVEPRPARDARLTIVANGPSALAAPLTRPPTLAINNALRLFVDRGLAPDYWIASDPQACVADYVRDAPRDTTYLVASKCHPALFEALRDRRIVLWHCGEPGTLDLFDGRLVIPTSITVTLCALNLMPVLGYHAIETWGWDGCYLAGRDHAVGQAHRADDITVHLPRRRGRGPAEDHAEDQAAEQVFATTRSWAAEAEEAVCLFQDVHRDVTVRGDGMIGAILRELALA